MEGDSLFEKVHHMFHDEEELDDAMKQEAALMIRNIFRYMEKDAKDIMTHRKNIVAIDGEEDLEEALRFMLEQNFSRFPVYQEDIDGIIGFVHVRDVMKFYLGHSDSAKVRIADLKEYIRSAMVVPETKSIDALFKKMQASKVHFVLVLDEYGQTSGVVTMEDILEELVGDIFDEHDVVENMITKLKPGKYIANGLTDLEDLEDLLEISFNKDEFETLNGFLINELDHIPEEGECYVLNYQGYRFTVISVEDNIIRRVKIEKLSEE